jgi:hypothetical protein
LLVSELPPLPRIHRSLNKSISASFEGALL